MNNWKLFKNETPNEGQRIDAGAWSAGASGKHSWVVVNFIYKDSNSATGWNYWRDATPPPAPSKMEQAWEALPDTGDEDWKIKPCGDLVLRHDFEFGFQQAEKVYGLKEGETQ